ncbi:MAG: FxLYD domain-containing protein [Vicinamibacterales bacterium]
MLLVVTGVSVVVAAVSLTVAWQVAQADRRRRAARVAALAAAAGVHEAVAGIAEPTPEPAPLDAAPAAAPALAPGGIALGDRFLAADTSGSGSAGRQHWLMAGATFAAVLVVTAGIVSLVGTRRAAAGDVVSVPLELVALAHNRADGVLTVSGLVRNPATGTPVDKLEAEVRVFDPAGILIATRTAVVDHLELAPGQESPFAVTLGEARTAARYRVSFRTAGTMRPHVDQRTNLPASVDRTAEAR